MPNKIYGAEETAKVWTDTGGDYALDLGGLAAGSVRQGAQGDLGATPRATRYAWQLFIDGFDTAPVVGEEVVLYLGFAYVGSNTIIDGDLSTSDSAGATVDLPNLLLLGAATVQTTTAADELIISGEVEILARYVTPVIYNATADALLSSGDSHSFTLIPMPPEVQ